jgi:uncharacterized protein
VSTTTWEILEKNVIAATTAWLEKVVIGLNLCPFAKAIHVKKQIRYSVSPAVDGSSLLADFKRELAHLVETSPEEIESTLIIHPRVLTDFLEYNEFLAVCDNELEEMGLDGIVQVASFHPAYQFAGTKAGDVTNFTNRSPFPTLHLLRESSVSRAVAQFPNVDGIYKANMETMRKIGKTQLERMVVDLLNTGR